MLKHTGAKLAEACSPGGKPSGGNASGGKAPEASPSEARAAGKVPSAKTSGGKPLSVWFLVASLYTTQYLALSFFSVALVAILREQGASLEKTSSVYLLGMIGACRFLWAPLIDRVRFSPSIGHYRGWLLMMQAALIVILCGIAFQDIRTDYTVIYVLCIAMAVCGATQDIATDGLVCSMLSQAERGFGNGIQTAGGMCGFLIGAGLVLIAYPIIGWHMAIMLLVAGTAVSFVQLLFFKEPVWSQSRFMGWQAVTRLWSVWKQPGMVAWFGVLLLFPMGITLAYSLLAPVLIDLHWTLERIGLLVNVLGSAMGVIASLLAGWLIMRFNRKQVTLFCGLTQLVSISAVLAVVFGGASSTIVVAAVVLHFLGYVPSVTLLSTGMMDRASPASPATDYTVQYGVYQFCAMAVGGMGMAMAGRFGYAAVLFVALGCTVLGGLFAYMFSRHITAEVIEKGRTHVIRT